jgi:5-methylcytosine-specific restriction endonuclease McrA
MRTLVLNAGYEPMQLISWQRALCLVLSDKAEIVATYDAVVRSISKAVNLPSVVRLTRYVRVVSRFGFVRCTRKNVLLRDGYQCQYCGVKCRPGAITIDHVVPRSRGGKTTWTNVVAACHPCNRRKGSRPLEKCGLVLSRMPRRPLWKELIDDQNREASHDWLPYLDEKDDTPLDQVG